MLRHRIHAFLLPLLCFRPLPASYGLRFPPGTISFLPGVSGAQRELGGQGRVLGVGRGNDLRPRGSSKRLRADNTSLSSVTPSSRRGKGLASPERLRGTHQVSPGVRIRAMSWHPPLWDLLLVWVPLVFCLPAVVPDCRHGSAAKMSPTNWPLGSFYIGHLMNGDTGKEKGPHHWAA